MSLCFWEREFKGERQMIVIGKEQDEGTTHVEGIQYFGMDAGKCGLKILYLKNADFSQWNCTLGTNDGWILRGTVDLLNEGTRYNYY